MDDFDTLYGRLWDDDIWAFYSIEDQNFLAFHHPPGIDPVLAPRYYYYFPIQPDTISIAAPPPGIPMESRVLRTFWDGYQTQIMLCGKYVDGVWDRWCNGLSNMGIDFRTMVNVSYPN